MMPAINEAMLAISNSLAGSIVAKATVIMALGLIAAWAARGSRASVRHALLAASFGALLAIPIASFVATPRWIAITRAVQAPTSPESAGAGRIASPARPAPLRSVAAKPAAPTSEWLSLSAVLLAGMAVFFVPVAIGLWQVRALRRSALPWPRGQSLVESLASEAGIQRRVEVLLHESLPGPMTCGVLHPAIVLSRDAQTWEEDDLNRAMVHELEHVRRGDWAIHCLARTVCAAYWFHPLVWIGWRRLMLEAERSCDDAVLGRSDAAAYADQLVGLARRLSAASKSPLLAMANRADLTARVHAVLDGRRQRGRAGALPVAATCAAALALIFAIAPVRVVAATPSASADAQAGSRPQFSAAGDLVIEDIAVKDQYGRTIEGLTANDFVVTEDGVPQTVEIFEFQKLASTPQVAPNSVSSYYLLGYYPSNPDPDGKYRRVKITCRAPSVKLDYRPGYYAGRPVASDQNVVSDATAPVVIRRKQPEYSDGARKAKFQGSVVMAVDVDASGNVANARVMRSLGLGLDEKALEAVRQWTFTPATKDGRPAAMEVEVKMSFRLW